MNIKLKKLACCAATSALLFIPAASTWAVPLRGAAHSSARLESGAKASRNSTPPKFQTAGSQVRNQLPLPVRFSEVRGRGLLLSVWVNGAGPYIFALDTGAGATIISGRVGREARVLTSGSRTLMIQGISGRGAVSGREVSISSLAVGSERNVFPSKGLAVLIESLAPGLDGVLDPVEAYGPFGFEIDMPGSVMTSFDPRSTPLSRTKVQTTDTAVVPWLVDGSSRRPSVMLDGGMRALIDTGSGLGLAVTAEAALRIGIMPGRDRRRVEQIRDLGGGTIAAHRIAPATIRIGPLVLKGIPTDLVPNASANSPILLGRDALRPFRLAFDPINRLIRFVPS